MLQFLVYPFLVAGAVAASIPLIIHLLNRERATRLVYSTIRFIKMSHQVNVQRHKLKQLLLLLMRLLILAILGIAFARPFFADRPTATGATGGKRNVVIILDNSYSMSRNDTFDRAKEEAQKIADGLQRRDTSALVFTSNRAHVVKALDTEHQGIRPALTDAKITNLPTDYLDAIQAANEMLQQADIGQKEIHLIADLQKIGWENFIETDRLNPGVQINFIDMSADAPRNLAITGISVPQVVLNERKPAEVVVRVQNFSDEAVENLPVKLLIDQILVGTTAIDIEPNNLADATFNIRFQTEDVHTGYAEIPDDAITVDNRRYLLIQSLRSIKVHAVNGEPGTRTYQNETFFLQMALEPGTQNVPIQYTQSTTIPDNEKIDSYDVLILANLRRPTASQAQTLKTFVGAGGGLIVTAGDKIDRDAYQTTLGVGDDPLMPCNFVQPVGDALNRDVFRIIATLNYNHPLFHPFKDPNHGDFGKGRFYRYLQAVPLANSVVLAQFDDGSPALFEKTYGSGRVLCFTSTIDREWTDFPIHAVYLPFIHEAVKYLALKRTARHPDYRVGDPVELTGYELPAGTEVAIFNPSNQETRTQLNEHGTVFYDKTEYPGIYSAHISAQKTRYFTVNTDIIESDLAARDTEELKSMLTGDADAAPTETVTTEMTDRYKHEVEKDQSVWWYLMLGLFTLAVVEMFFANRI